VLDLGDPEAVAGGAHGDERGARSLRAAGGPVPGRAEAGDQRGVREALDVLDERRAAADSGLRRSRW
jgi:hypothetical protein